MSQLAIKFPIRDETCSARTGEYYGFAYYDYGNNNPTRTQFQLGHRAITDPTEALHMADVALQTDNDSIYNKKLYASAATIVRLCMKHERPQLEVLVNSVAQTDDEVYGLEGVSSIYDADRGSKMRLLHVRANVPAGRQYGHHLDIMGWASGGRRTALYLPREDFSLAKKPHTGIISAPGGDTNPFPIGILGGEQLVRITPNPDNRPD